MIQGPLRSWAIRDILSTQNYLKNSEIHPNRERPRKPSSYNVWGSPRVAIYIGFMALTPNSSYSVHPW